MPNYQYKCPKCGSVKDVIKKFSECDDLERCECGEPMLKTISAPLFFKGDGYWFRNGYENRSKHDLEDALKEHDGHRRTHDKIIDEERRAGILTDE